MLDFARREAKKLLVGKTGYGPSCKQDDINALMVGLARQGKRVVRLKGGDPLIFARAAEEIAACREADIAVDVVPGITAAQGAAAGSACRSPDADSRAACNTSPAMRATANCRTISTGRASPIRRPPRRSICRPRRLAALVARAIEQGLDPQTPALAIARATRPDQAVIAEAVARLPGRLAEELCPGRCW